MRIQRSVQLADRRNRRHDPAILVLPWVSGHQLGGMHRLWVDVTFDDLAPTLCLACFWLLTGVLRVRAALSGALSGVVAPVRIFACLIASQEAPDLAWVQTVGIVILGWLAHFANPTIIIGAAGNVLGSLVALSSTWENDSHRVHPERVLGKRGQRR
jgi:hypothetical protein